LSAGASPDSLAFLGALFALGVASGGTAAVVGFGIGSLLTPLFLTRMEPAVAVGAVALPHLAATAVRAWQHWPAVDRSVLLRFGLPGAAGGLAGALLQAELGGRLLYALLGALLLATGIAGLTRGFGGWHPPAPAALALGLLSGVFGGLAGNQGGLRAAGLSAFDLSPRAFLATSTAVALLVDVMRTPVYLLRGGPSLLALAAPIAAAAAGCLLGTVLGERVLLGLARERHRQVVGAAVAALGVWLLLRAVLGP
jgi:uncharacterized membrane protein YfcA